jgi:ATP-dependent RNA helicase RhlE
LTFQELQLSEPLLRALADEGYTDPTPIQEQAIPFVLQGKDLFGCAQTGTGKTAAFAIPIIQMLNQTADTKGYKHIKALVLTPTRELAIQIDKSFSTYGKHTPIKHNVIFGGVSQSGQLNALKSGTDVLIATPGRLLDLMNQGYVHLDDLQFFVLDEADRMLDMGFIHDIKKIIRVLPKERQTLFFSATIPSTIVQLADSLLRNPVKVEVTPVSTTAEKVEQSVFMVAKQDKASLLVHLLQEKGIDRTLVFTRTKHGADKIVKHLNKVDIKADALHGNKSQNARERALDDFKNNRLKVLVATDIAARGIDVDNLTHVINFDLPDVPETYVHRIGRTGRAGNSGIAFSFCDAEERLNLRDINKITAQSISVDKNHPYVMPDSVRAMPAPPQQQRSSQHRLGQQGNRRYAATTRR